MKLGVFSVLLGNWDLKKTCEYLASKGVQTIEIGTGGCPGKAHCDPQQLLGNPQKIKEFKATIEGSGLEISALSCHGNPVHPQKEIADRYHNEFMDTLQLANELGVDRVIGFSGCPGDSEGSLYPNWVTCAWPDDFLKVVEWQWNEKLIPYWTRTAAEAEKYGVHRIAFEMHPGFCVYNPETLLRLREAVGPTIGANFDPSHLFWQGIDPVAAVRYLGEAIYYVHAKDTKIDPINTARNGVLDYKHYSDEIHRSWIFRSVGYGHDAQLWKDFVSALRMVGYDDVMSIEHEDSLMTPLEGLEKAIDFLKEVMVFQSNDGELWWA